MSKKIFLLPIYLLLTGLFIDHASAQAPTWTIDLLGKEKKPSKFENRKLGSEKMADKKFTVIRHFFQNNYTHYNYYYNAKNKINSIIERAKLSQKDDYNNLLSYYPYSLENTASQKTELDSVILKATAGILLHDLRNDWIDNMYLLMGKAFYFRKEFDSAAATFQFINYNLFPRKKNEDDNRIIGTSDASTNNVLSIANKEKQNIFQKVAALPPSRNDALIWMARTLIEQNEMGESASLINTLQYDPNLPARLRNDLNDANAYWFYKQNIYDSAAFYLEKALDNADTKQDYSRSEFLLAQLYEINHNYDKADLYYKRVSTHTVNLLMDIFARLNNAKMLKSSNPAELIKSIQTLVGMANKDKFETYRDIIFYSAGELALQKPDTAASTFYFEKSLKFSTANISLKNKAFLQLADIAYNQKKYKTAFANYDSLQTGDTTLKSRLASIQSRRNTLAKIAEKIIIIEREDSLQLIAAMAPLLREAFVKKLAKQLRKERGLKDEQINVENPTTGFINKQEEVVDLFAASAGKGEWYFYNASLKAKGFNDFKRKWGTRKNIDNWRRKGAIETNITNGIVPGVVADDINKPTGANAKNNNENSTTNNVSFGSLMANIPLTANAINASNTLVAVNLFELAKLFQNDLEDYSQAIITYHQSLERFPDSLYNGELYLGLYFCYAKLGFLDKAAYYKNLINKNFATTHSAKLLNDPSGANPKNKNAVGTKRYEQIYNMFIEGNFDKAFAEKKNADSVYGTNFWSPQLLYIEAVYHIKQRNDSLAINVLKSIVELYSKAPLATKAATMIDVLKRRKEIEDYLTKLKITRATDDEIVKATNPVLIRDDSNLIKSPVRVIDTTKIMAKPVPLPVKDTVKTPPVPVIKDTIKTIVTPKIVPPVTIKDSVKPAKLPVVKDSIKKVITPKITPPVITKDSVKAIKIPAVKDSIKKIVTPKIVAPVVIKDTVKKSLTEFANAEFSLNTALPHNVIMILDKVDGTYINESKNAFTRYLNESFKGQPIVLTRDAIDKDKALLIFTSFNDANAAYQFLLKVKKAAPDEISWLPANKYSFYLISTENLELLKTNKNIAGYIGLLNKVYPGKF